MAGVVVAVVAGRSDEDKGTATKTVRMVIGSEKAEFFADPDVVKALAAKGYTVKAETSGSWAMEGLDLKGFDLAFPSSQAPAVELAAKYKVTGTLPRPFYSPLVVVAHKSAAGVLAGNGLATLDAAHRGTLKMAPYLDAARADRTWQQLKGAGKYGELTGTLYLSSTDPETSNSGALYLAAASYVAAGGKVVASDADIGRTAPLLKKLVSVQGAQQSSTDAAFRDFVSGAGNPLVWSTSRRSPRFWRAGSSRTTWWSSTRTPPSTATTPPSRSPRTARLSPNSSPATRGCARWRSGTGSARRASPPSSPRPPPTSSSN